MAGIEQKIEAPLKAVGPLDIVLVVLVIALSIACIPLLRSHTPVLLVVRRDHTLIGRYLLSEKRELRIHGAIGPMEITIAENGVRVLHATCKNQVCVQTGLIRRPFQQIICVPNHITLTIESAHAGTTIDAVVR
jgi:hypothetical protein